MPVEVAAPIVALSQSEFHAIDEKVMRIVFDVHNECGRFFDELIYKQAIAARYLAAGLGIVQREVRIRLFHRSFAKDLYLDLLFEHGALVEAKTAETLVPAHRNQTLTYLFLARLHHARLVNLRPEKVGHEFVSTKLTTDARKQFVLNDHQWEKVNSESLWLKEAVRDLLSDWGAFLDVGLYREAITHFLGGPERVLSPIAVTVPGITATQKVHLLAPDTAFAFTAILDPLTPMAEHLRRFLCHTTLRYIQWVNFNRHEITLQTLRKTE